MNRRWPLVLWLFVILFPFSWLGNFSPRYRSWFDVSFEPDWIHVLAHTILFAVLAVLIVWIFKLPRTWRTFWLLVVLLLAAGLAQEILQSVTRLEWDWLGMLFDLFVDLSGGTIGLALLSLDHRWS